MRWLTNLSRVVFKFTFLRGRHRVPKLLFVLIFSAIVFTVTRLTICNLQPAMCGIENPNLEQPIGKRGEMLQQGPEEEGGPEFHIEEQDSVRRKGEKEMAYRDKEENSRKEEERVRAVREGEADIREAEGHIEVGGAEEGAGGAGGKKAVNRMIKEPKKQEVKVGGDKEEEVKNVMVGDEEVKKDGIATVGVVKEKVGVAEAKVENMGEAKEPVGKDGAKEKKDSIAPKDKGDNSMSAEEVAKAIQSGTMCKTVCPPFTWSEWSPCSKACGRGRRYRKALYEIVCKFNDKCPSNHVEEAICETPCRFDPDKYGGPDGLDMYPINPLNPPAYPEDRHYMCGHWLVEYVKIHNEIMTGIRPPSYLVYSTGKGVYPTAGGLASRIRGITTVFFMAVLLERAFLIEWEDPPGLEKYLIPKTFDWSNLGVIQKYKRGPTHEIGSWHSSKEHGKSSQWYMNTNFTQFFKNPVEVIQSHRYDFTYAILRNAELMPKAYELGVDRVKCRVCCAWDMLFNMAPEFEKEMNKILQSLGYPQKPLMTIQVRTKSDDVQKAVIIAEHSVHCGQKVARDLKMSPVFVPIFNNRLVVHIISKKYKRNMKTPIQIDTATRTVHTHIGNLPIDTEKDVFQGVQERTFKEFFLMLNSTILIRTKGYMGSFGGVAEAIRRHHTTPGTVYSYTAGGSSCALFPQNSKIE